ncbi:MAG: site-specific integrase, partial [Holosporales bacterium]|nr:site-specific integrase [Holosporales bacterium]
MILSWLKNLCGSQGFSENTVHSYYQDISILKNFLTEYRSETVTTTDIINIKKQEVRAWFLFRKNKGDKEKSIARGLSALKNFLKYCVETGITIESDIITMRSPRVRKTLPRPITAGQINSILESVPILRLTNWIVKRDVAVLSLIYSVGLR